MGKIPVGLQLYTLRAETAKDFKGTLEKVAAMGYSFVEFAGYGGIPAKEMKKILDGLGLKVCSSHVTVPLDQPDALMSELNQQIEYNKEIGNHYIVTPFAPIKDFKSDEQFTTFLQALTTIAEECRRQGVQHVYHNHDFELTLQHGGKRVLDWIFANIEPELTKAEIDLYWVQKAGYSPKDYLLKYKGRTPLVHVKDMTGDERKFFAEVGYGIMNYDEIFAIAAEAGVEYYLVEQDDSDRDPLESVKMSIDYLKSIGIA